MAGRATRRLRAAAAHLGSDPPTFTAAPAAADGGDEPPPPKYTEVPRLPLGSDAAATHLERHGYVACAAALTHTECEEVLDGMWRWLEGLGTGISRAEPATWSDAAWPPDAGRKGIITNAGVTHTDWAWRVRAHPAVVRAWRSVLHLAEDEPVIASLDGLSMFRPWGLDAGWATEGGWWHMGASQHHPPLCRFAQARGCSWLAFSRV